MGRKTEAFLSLLAGEPRGDPRAEERRKRRAQGQQRALELKQQTEREEEAQAAAYISEETERANRIFDRRPQRTGKSMPWSRKKDKKRDRSDTEEDRPPPPPKDSEEEQPPISDPSAIEAQPEQRHHGSPSRSNRGSPKKDLRPPTGVSAPPVDLVIDRPHPKYNSRMQGEHTEPQRSTTPNNDGPQIIAELAGRELNKHPSWPATTSKQQHDLDVSRPPRSRYSDYDEHYPPPRRSSLPPPERRPVGAEHTGRQRRSRGRNHENARPEVSFQAANNLDLGPALFRSNTGGSDPNIVKRDEERPSDPLKVMCKEYRRLMAEHSTLEFERPFTLAQVAVASQCVINGYKTLSLKVQDLENSITLKNKDYESLQRSQTELQNKLESEVNLRDEHITQLRTESARKQGRIEQLNEECEKRDGQMKELRKEHQAETRTLIENGNTRIQLLEKQKDQHEQELEKLKKDHVKEKSNLEIWYKEKNTELTNQLLIQRSIADAELQKANEAAENELQRQLAIVEAKIEAQILRHEGEIKKAEEAHAEEMTQTTDWYRAQDTQLRSELEGHRQQLQRELQTEKENHEKLIGKANEDWGKRLRKKQTELEGLKEIHKAELKEADEGWGKLVQEKQTKLDQIDAVHGEKMRAANEEWEKRLQNKQTELDGINAVREEAMRNSNEEWERRLQGKQAELDGVRTAHIDALRTVNEGWEKQLQNKQTEVDGLISSCRNRIGKLSDSYEVRLANHNLGLRATNEQLKNALVERDHFTVISDREVANVFQDISSYVEEFAGEPWDRSLQDTWPFPSAAFEEVENDRRTRTHLIQNTLWVILYEMIFCTPFRVFGEEGVKLDMQWLEKYSQGSKSLGTISPRPSREAEQWRYKNMLTCVEATSQPLSKWEHNSRNFNIRRGYESTLQKTVNEMCRELEYVIMVFNDDRQRMNRIVKKAADLWLEIGQQRYRMFVVMSASGKEPKRSARAALDRNRTLEMVIEPGLRRFGSAKGEQLEKEAVVVDCTGKFSTFHCSV